MEHLLFNSALQIAAWQYLMNIFTISLSAMAVAVAFFGLYFARKDKSEKDLSFYAKDKEVKEVRKSFYEKLEDLKKNEEEIKNSFHEKLTEFKEDNEKDHDTMIQDTKAVENRLTKRDDEIKEEFLRIAEVINKNIGFLLQEAYKNRK